MDNITDFLYLIGSVFAPMIAIQIADFYLLKQDHSQKGSPYLEYDHLGDRIRFVPDSDECRYAGGEYIAGYGDHDRTVSDRREINT